MQEILFGSLCGDFHAVWKCVFHFRSRARTRKAKKMSVQFFRLTTTIDHGDTEKLFVWRQYQLMSFLARQANIHSVGYGNQHFHNGHRDFR